MDIHTLRCRLLVQETTVNGVPFGGIIGKTKPPQKYKKKCL
jgi:hypothetical protein